MRPRGYQAAQMDEEKRQRGQTLLAIDNEPLIVLVGNDDRTKEVIAISRDIGKLMVRLIVIEERRRKVLNQFFDLTFFPAILTLIEVDFILLIFQEAIYLLGVGVDDIHRRPPSRTVSTRISSSSPSVWASRARMSA